VALDIFNASVEDAADAVAGGEHFVIVRGADHGDAFFAVELAQEIDDFFAGRGV
jgi:hypothetical protein